MLQFRRYLAIFNAMFYWTVVWRLSFKPTLENTSKFRIIGALYELHITMTS